jgi:Uma2 family endonuclease
MAVALRREKFYTPDEYLALEERADYKSEYYQGVIYAIAGGSLNHNRIVGGIYALLHTGLRSTPCEAFNSDMRLLVKANGLYTYPDAMVVCGRPELAAGRTDTLTNPVVIVEVLSKTTADYDRGGKFELYRALPSLMDYVMIHQDRVHIEYQHKQSDGRWVLTELTHADEILTLASIQLEIPVRLIYERADWLAA